MSLESEVKKMNEEIKRMESYLIETGIATEEEVILVTNIKGYNVETMEDILDVRTGYKHFDQLDDFKEGW